MRVRLKPNLREGRTEEQSGILYEPLPGVQRRLKSLIKSHSKLRKKIIVVVFLDKKYRDSKWDDGLREVSLDQVKEGRE